MGLGHRATFHLVEASVQRGRIIFFDAGAIDFGSNLYREPFAGGGYIFAHTKRWLVIQTAYLLSPTGPARDNGIYLQPSTIVAFKPKDRIAIDVNVLPYLPLNRAATFQILLDHAMIEYDFGSVRLGAGYAAYQFRGEPWIHRPIAGAFTLETRFGEFQFWPQKWDERWHLHIRWMKVL
jgi:hypothetical protein